MGPKSHHEYPYKREAEGDRHTEERQCENKTIVMQPQATDGWEPPGTERGQEPILFSLWRGSEALMISDFWSPGL